MPDYWFQPAFNADIKRIIPAAEIKRPDNISSADSPVFAVFSDIKENENFLPVLTAATTAVIVTAIPAETASDRRKPKKVRSKEIAKSIIIITAGQGIMPAEKLQASIFFDFFSFLLKKVLYRDFIKRNDPSMDKRE